jgi:ADP-ribose pyrophosphatase
MARGRFLELCRDGHWEFVRRIGSLGAAFVLAVTDANEMVLVEQYRVPVRGRVIELVAGIVGDDPNQPAEAPANAALRELEEEAGFRAERVELLLEGPVAPGLANEHMTLWRAIGLRRVGDGGGLAAEHEHITVHLVPLGEVIAFLAERQRAGIQVDSRVYTGLYFIGAAAHAAAPQPSSAAYPCVTFGALTSPKLCSTPSSSRWPKAWHPEAKPYRLGGACSR